MVRESEWEREVGGSGERATAAAFMRTLVGMQRGGRRHVVSVVRALFFAFGFLHLALQLHFACVYTHIYKYMYTMYTRRILRICNIFRNVECDEFLHFHSKRTLLKYILLVYIMGNAVHSNRSLAIGGHL